jgi:hypothetical protein
MRERKKNRQSREEHNPEIITDPQGSWTGVPVDDEDAMPIQDADDL